MLLGQNQDLTINIRKENIGEILLIPKLKEENIALNKAQETAIKNAQKYHLSLVIGPPGSGKTLLLVNLVYNILQRKGSSEKILICAPTNKAIDNIIILLKKFGFEKFIRVLSPAKELSEDLDTSHSLHKLALEKINANPEKYKEIKKLIEKKENETILSDSDYKKHKKYMEDIEGEIIEEAEIVLSTINNSADERLKNYYFSYVLIDEAAQALEAETLLPMIHLECSYYNNKLGLASNITTTSVSDNFYLICQTHHLSFYTIQSQSSKFEYKKAGKFFYLEAPRVFICGNNWGNGCSVLLIIIFLIFAGFIVLFFFLEKTLMITKSSLNNIKLEILKQNRLIIDEVKLV